MAHYLLSIYQPIGDPPPADRLAGIMRAVDVVRAEMIAAGAWVFSGGLHDPSAAAVADPRRAGAAVTDGPYVESKEHVGGLTIITAADRAEATEWGRRLARATTLPVEVREFIDGPVV
ncbi:YciI family protein [Isoptericola sp. b441]|uniref:YciI family protein n=1 Tax=Actinotalea lenta TaxID=3064654 RepID=A0ABT9D538_9CELL|nr:YciI family protein [Isoptericola sp. b441]MDO8105860.1 YciI family protein [Isoptericola sp. b441]